MGLKTTAQNINLWGRQVAYRPVRTVTATPTTLFTVIGGPVKITAIVAYIATAITTGVTWHIVACGTPMDAALFAALGAAGTNVVWPLDVGAALIPPSAASPAPSILGAAFNVFGVIVGPGAAAGNNIVLTYGVALIDGTVSFSVEYYRQNPDSRVIPIG